VPFSAGRPTSTWRMSALGHSLPMHSAPVLPYVGNGLKAEVTGKGWNGKTVTRSRAPHRATLRVPHCNAVITAKQIAG
jgi:hypothetical protein